MSNRLHQLERENETLRRMVAERDSFIAGVKDLLQKLVPNRSRRGYVDPDEVLRGITNGQDRKAPTRRRHSQGIPL